MKKEFQMRIVKVAETEFSIKQGESDFSSIGMGFNMSFSKKDTDMLSIILKIFYADDSNHKDILLSIGAEAIFEVVGLDNIATFEDNRLQIPSELMETLLSITYSTIRGILVCRTQGTLFADHPLPLISPKNLATSFQQK